MLFTRRVLIVVCLAAVIVAVAMSVSSSAQPAIVLMALGPLFGLAPLLRVAETIDVPPGPQVVLAPVSPRPPPR